MYFQEITLSTPRVDLHYQLLFGKMLRLSPNCSIVYWAIRNKCTIHHLDHLNQYNKILLYFHPRPRTHNPWCMMHNTKCMNNNSWFNPPRPTHPRVITSPLCHSKPEPQIMKKLEIPSSFTHSTVMLNHL